MKERLNYFDVLRSLAIFGVVFIHTNNIGYVSEKFSFNYNLSLILRQIVNFSVPLFLFISGYFMSKKIISSKEDYYSYVTKQIPRVLVPFIIWSCIYSAISFVMGSPVTTILKKFITFQAAAPFYFILLIIQYYLFQPLIVKLGTTKKSVFLALLISLSFCAALEVLRYKYDINLPIYIYAGNFLTWLIFPVLGSYVQKNGLKISASVLLFGSIFFLIISIAHSLFSIIYFNKPIEAVTAVKVSSFLYSASLCLYLYKVQEKLAANKLIVNIGLLSFGIYFSHMLFLTVILRTLPKIVGPDLIANVFVQIIIAIVVLLLSYFFGIIIQKINANLAKKYFGY